MFGKMLGKVSNDPATKKKLNDAAEKASGVDLDGDGLIGGEPVKPKAQEAPAPAAGAHAGGGKDLLSNLLHQSSKLKAGGLMSMLGDFKKLPSNVQKDADAASRDLDDGSKIPLSTLTGSKKSLLVGINYIGTPNALRGCINDVMNVRKLITDVYKFPTDAASQRILIDDGTTPMPTRANMLEGFKWLIAGAKSGDSLFFHYSGHGASQKDVSPDTDEADGMDETLVPCDYNTAGMVVDDEIFDLLVAPLPKGVRLTAVMDCCHSGSVFDLPYTYILDGSRDLPIEVDNRKLMMASAMAAGKALMAKDSAGAMKNLMEAGKAYMAMQGQKNNNNSGAAAASPAEPSFSTPAAQPAASASAAAPAPSAAASVPASTGGKIGTVSSTQNVSAGYINVKTTVADVIQFSGCKDEQTSADAFINGEASGAMSYALIKAITDNGPKQTYAELLRNIRTTLLGKYKQLPQLSAGHRLLDLDAPFAM